jgi:NADH:ubiquinone oxidoreductase subunit K
MNTGQFMGVFIMGMGTAGIIIGLVIFILFRERNGSLAGTFRACCLCRTEVKLKNK